MRMILQRVAHSQVAIHQEVVGQIQEGFMVLVGFCEEDTSIVIDKMVDKMIHLRVFEDQKGKMNLSLMDIEGSVLSISQFTLYADCRKGRRPSFIKAAKPNIAIPLYDYFNQCLKDRGVHVETGQFGADMKVSLLNDGPVTIFLDSEEFF